MTTQLIISSFSETNRHRTFLVDALEFQVVL